MSRYSLIHVIFNAVPAGNRGLDRRGDHLVRLISRVSWYPSGIPTYATLEKLSEDELLGVAQNLGVHSKASFL